MRTPVKILTPKEYKALRARPGKCAAPRHVDVVDALANMRTVHLRAKGRVRQEVRRWLITILREAEAHLRSGGPLRLTRAGAAGKRNRHGLVPINRDTRPQGGTKPALRALHHPPYRGHTMRPPRWHERRCRTAHGLILQVPLNLLSVGGTDRCATNSELWQQEPDRWLLDHLLAAPSRSTRHRQGEWSRVARISGGRACVGRTNV